MDLGIFFHLLFQSLTQRLENLQEIEATTKVVIITIPKLGVYSE